MKYVMFKDKNGHVTPLLFDERFVHADMKRYGHLAGTKLEPVSAGFYNPITRQTYGESETLGLGSR